MHTMTPNKEAVRSGDLIFFGGILSLDDEGNLRYPYNVECQTEVILQRIASYLQEEVLGLEHLVYVKVYITDIRHYDIMNKVYRRVMPEPLPPRKVITGPLTVEGALVEMTAIASIYPKRVLRAGR